MTSKKPARVKSKEGSEKKGRRRAAPRLPALVKPIVAILEDQKASDIRAIPLENHLADAFVIATAVSPRHLHSLTEHLLQKMESEGVKAHHVEGYGTAAPSSRWVLVDFIDIVVHLFTEEGRQYFGLDRLMEERQD